jgi:hypothetical protein
MKKKIHNLNYPVHNFKIEERRRRVASLLAQSMTETEIEDKEDHSQSETASVQAT